MSEEKNQKLQATSGWPQCGTLAIEVSTRSRQKCIHKGTAHCLFFDCEAGDNKSIVQAFAEANLSIGHHAFGSICLVELDSQEHIQHCNFLDLCDDKAADKDNRDFGTKLNWKKALGSLGLATAIPTCGSEAAVAQELQQEDSCESSLTEIRYVFVCCVQPGSEIAHDLEQYSGAAHALAKAAYCRIFPRYV